MCKNVNEVNFLTLEYGFMGISKNRTKIKKTDLSRFMKSPLLCTPEKT